MKIVKSLLLFTFIILYAYLSATTSANDDSSTDITTTTTTTTTTITTTSTTAPTPILFHTRKEQILNASTTQPSFIGRIPKFWSLEQLFFNYTKKISCILA